MLQALKFTLLFMIWLFSNHLYTAETINLPAPNFSEDNIVNAKTAMRPFHETPFHLKAEIHYRNEKPFILIHNYRDGDAGWTYAPGRMEVSYENMLKAYHAIGKTLIPANESIAVIGGGVHGLMIANKLAEIGHPVTIYAENFSPNTFSDIHACIFMPLLNAKKTTDSLINQLEFISYKTYESWINPKNHNGYHGVTPVDLYLINDNGSFNRLTKNSFIPEAEAVTIQFDNNKNISAKKYRSFILDTPLIQKEMMRKAKMLGIKFIYRKTKNLADCLTIDADVIFNCIGLGANETFLDDKIVPQTHHSICFQSPVKDNYVIYINHLDETHTYYLANNNTITVSGTFPPLNKNNFSETTNIKHLLKRANRIAMH